jgi:hypothetical protein
MLPVSLPRRPVITSLPRKQASETKNPPYFMCFMSTAAKSACSASDSTSWELNQREHNVQICVANIRHLHHHHHRLIASLFHSLLTCNYHNNT